MLRECQIGARSECEDDEIMEPRMSPFNDPTEFSEVAAVFGAAPGDDRFDATLAMSAVMRVGVVAAVGVHDLGLAKRSAAHASNRRDGVDQRQQLRDIDCESRRSG
jgi:hypothetical protein